jgi:hypothetical protein
MRDLISRYRTLRSYVCLGMWPCLIVNAGCRPAASSQITEVRGRSEASAARKSLAETCDLDDFESKMIGVCPTSDCFPNGPTVNRFPINGMNPEGCKNQQGIWLVPGSIQGSRSAACNGHSLDVNDKGELTALDSKDCLDSDLVGASFQLKRKDPRTGIEQHAELVIHHTESLSYYGHTVRGYVFTRPGSEESVCNWNEATKLEAVLFPGFHSAGFWISPLKNHVSRISSMARNELESIDGMGADVENEKSVFSVAVVFRGKLYNDSGEAVAGSERDGWFNIACARDALAKLDILRIAPHDDSKARVAALRMLTANYCNVKARYTFEGNEIEYKKIDPSRHETCEPTMDGRPLEAAWDDHGAACIERTRLFARRDQPDFRSRVAPARCQPPNRCDDEPAYVNGLWSECDLAKHPVKHTCTGVSGLYCSYPKS